MNFLDWYTDTMDIWRVVPVTKQGLTTHERKQISQKVPCRIYQTGGAGLRPLLQAADLREELKLACGLSVDVRSGDEALVHRGGGLGKETETIRAFVGSVDKYFEPFGAVVPGLDHQEITLLNQERVNSL